MILGTGPKNQVILTTLNGRGPVPPKELFLSENVIFRGLRLSLGHFGRQVSESPLSQLQNGASTSSLPPFIVNLLTLKVYARLISFFQWEF